MENSEVVAFDDTFVTLIKRFKSMKTTASAAEFFDHYYGAAGLSSLKLRLSQARYALIPLYNGNYEGEVSH